MNECIINDSYIYSKEDICSMCDVNEKTFRRFRTETDVQSIQIGSSHKEYFTEKTLKQFQIWLLKNQSNQGRSSEAVKEASSKMVCGQLAIQTLIQSGNVAAVQDFSNMMIQQTEQVAQQKQIIENQQKYIEETKPSVDLYNKVLSCDDTKSVGEVAKMLNMGRNKLFETLRELRVFMKTNIPYQTFIDRGYFKVIESMNNNRVYSTTRVTQKGIDFINKLLGA